MSLSTEGKNFKEFYDRILPFLNGMPAMVANRFSRSDLYSAEEKIVGQWIDGKPLYQKTINFGVGPANNQRKQVAHGISNLGVIVNIDCIAYTSTTKHKTPWVNTRDNINDTISIEDNNIVIDAYGVDTSSINYYVTLKYTKTTDDPIPIGIDTDYSETEKIIGTWIDGKPLYQKTWSIGLSEYADGPDHYIMLLDVSTLGIKPIKCDGMVYRGTESHASGFRNETRHLSIGGNSNKVFLYSNMRFTTTDRAIFTLQYTKTTD